MSTRTRRTILTVVMLLSLILQPSAVRATPPAQAASPVAAPSVLPEGPGYLFRVAVTADSPSRRARLEALGVVVLSGGAGEQGSQGAGVFSPAPLHPSTPAQIVVLADADQLADLARLGFRPQAADELRLLVSRQGPGKGWLQASLKPLLARAAEAQAALTPTLNPLPLSQNWERGRGQGDEVRAELHAAMRALTAEQQAAIAALTSVDDDGDGLTNTEEAWWCTDPLNPDTDGDGTTDGAEVQAAKDWLGNLRSGPPTSGKPFAGWPPQISGCVDDDQDSVPDMAERWELGLNMNRESTDRDKFDDGQELFGQTYCPGSGGYCGYGALPRNEDWGVIFAEMPSWVKAPGNHPLAAAFPEPKAEVVQSSLIVQAVTVVTTNRTVEQSEQHSYSTSVMTGTSTSIADTTTWNNWEEVSVTSPLVQASGLSARVSAKKSGLEKFITKTTKQLVKAVNIGERILDIAQMPIKAIEIGKQYGEGINRAIYTGYRMYDDIRSGRGLHWPKEYLDEYEALEQNKNRCTGGCGEGTTSTTGGSGVGFQDSEGQNYATGRGGRSITIGDDDVTVQRFYPVSFMAPAQLPTKTETSGHSWGGAQTTTNTEYQEHTVTNGKVFGTTEGWGTATAVDSSHAADLWFTYKVRNTGTEYAREIANLAFNIYIGDDPNPAITYFVGPDLGGDGKFHNFMPTEEHTYTSRRIPLTLEQMKTVDLGGPVRIVVEDFTYGIDELFYHDAVNASVLLAIEDGTDDGDEAIDTYLVPTWGEETVLDVLARYFPHTTDANGNLVAIWTPEYRADTPAWCVEPRRVGSTLWCKHALSAADWWNVYTSGMGDGSEGFQDTPAAPGSVALFRFNQDSDLDGYSDRSEERLGTDPNDPASFPRPELIAGVHSIRVGNQVTATLSLLNTGLYDAYGVEAVMIAPDDSVSITNNTVGGSGRVRAQKQVIVGSRILLQSPLPAQWTQSGHARPAVGGYYTGNTDRTYTFTVQCGNPAGCDVGSGTWSLAWNDGAGGSGALNFGGGYASPTLQNVGALGVKVGLLSGKVYNGESFTVEARTPRDTFQYTINREPYTEPIVIVSYNDPQGNHRFVTPVHLSTPTENLAAYRGQMLQDPGVEIVTTSVFTTGMNTTNLVVNNPTDVTLSNAHLFLEFVTITDTVSIAGSTTITVPAGSVTSEVPVTVTLLAGPTVVPVTWDTTDFQPPYDPNQDYIVMAFLTDYQGNILDTAARPLSSFQEDPKPTFAMADADELWDFGTAQRGTLLKRRFSLANTGFGDLKAMLVSSGGRWDKSVDSRIPNWIDTGITVQAGEAVGIRAGGTVCYGNNGTSLCYGPNGRGGSAAANWLAPGLPELSLAAKIGDGAPFLVGAHAVVTADRSGRLYLGANDCNGCYADNGGSYQARIEVYGLPVDGNRSLSLAPGDAGSFDLLINTADLPEGPFERTLTIRTSDPERPTRTLTVRGTITAYTPDTPPGSLQRPLDWSAPFASGTQGQWVEFTHTLGPDPQALHPVKVYSQRYDTLLGVGKYATPFGQGTASYDMFGDGRDGDLVVTSNADLNSIRASASGGAGSNVLAISGVTGSGFRVGQTVMIHQSRGNRAGQWELNRVQSVGTGQLTLNAPLLNTYLSDGGINRAQVLWVPEYRNLTINTGVTIVPAYWDRYTGGIVAMLVSGAVVINGSIQVAGNQGASGSYGSPSPAGGIGVGFRGGSADTNNNDCIGRGLYGEGTETNVYGTEPDSGNGVGNAGRGSDFQNCNGADGGGGGNGTPGGNGTVGNPNDLGRGGLAVGNPELTVMNFGGGGAGSSGERNTHNAGGGGSGGGIVLIFGKDIAIAGSINANGGNGGGYDRGAGGGAGGSILIKGGVVSVGNNRITAVGGLGGPGAGGGDGGLGRIRIEYCESFSGSTNPPASVQKLNCYIVEQVESAPYDRARLNLPETFSGGRTYQVQYGRRLVFGAAGEQTATLRVPAAAFANTTLDALISDVGSGSLTFRLDIGNDGSWDWEWTGNVDNAATLTNANLAAAFSRYWAAHGAPLPPNSGGAGGGLDVPVKVSLSKAGQVLLTNLQMTPTGSKVRYARVGAQGPAPLQTATVSFIVNNDVPNPGPLTVAADVGDDGTVDWAWSGTPAYPARLTTGNLASAFNAYLSSVGGQPSVDVPIRFYVAPFLPLGLADFSATPSARPDASIADGDVTFGNNTPTEGDTITVNATIHNTGALDTGPLAASFYAIPAGGTPWYIGSAFVPSIASGSQLPASISWNTLGFTGDIPVRVVVDPYNRVAELSETNNVATATVAIKTRPDLSIPALALSDDEPVAGRPVTVTATVRNGGQTAAGSQTTTLYNGNPDAGGTALGNRTVTSIAGGGSRTATFTWTPAKPGPYRLFARADRTGVVNESDEGNNDAWRDVYVGFAGPIAVDAGAASDPAYAPAAGYGYLNTGTRTVSCGGSAAPDATLRAAITSTLLYRFDHLLPGHYYHLDLTLRDCDGSRAEEVWVDGMPVAAATDLSDHQPHRLSLLLDPALYRDRTITAAIVETHGLDAQVAEISLHDVDYRYADAGHSSDPADPADPRYPGPAAAQTKGRAYGWLDGERLASWGNLPGQTVRMDRADDDPTDDPDSELRYRFDGLDPARRYRLRLTFRQLSGAAVIQKVQLDGTDATPSFTLASGQAYSLTVPVPSMAYAADGSIVVGIVRVDCAASEAQVNEIALEEETLPAGNPCNVRPTPNRTLATGRATIRGVPAPAGTVIEAVTPRDEVVGCTVVGTAGEYPLMQIYGADPTIPGMQDGEIVEFRVNGIPAVAQPSLYWKNDSTPHTVDLSIGSTEGQCSWLASGWNLFSFRLDPPVPTVEKALGAIGGRYCQVRGERAAYDCTQEPVYRTLKELDPGQSYWLKLEGSSGANLRIEGMSAPITTPLPLHQYWNWVGYLPPVAQPITAALQSIAGRYLLVLSKDKTYDPNNPGRSTLWTLEPGQGYQIRATEAVTLVYPSAVSAADLPPAPEGIEPVAAACSQVASTPSLTLLYGQARLGAAPAPAGAVVEIVTPRGDVAGCTVVRAGGEYGYVHVYGEDPTDPPVPGFREGEPLAFRINGVPVAPAPALTWQNDRTPHEVNLEAHVWQVWLPLVVK